MQKIIGLMGVKGAGKDTAANYLIAERQYQRVGFADALYREVAEAFGVTVALLGNRATKEKELPELALSHCRVTEFVECVGCHENRGILSLDYLSAPRSPRFIMQYWGTEFRRLGYPGVYAGEDAYWLNIVQEVLAASPSVSFVITDVRFPNEYQLVRDLNGGLGRVRWLEVEAREAVSRAKNGSSAHGSETALLNAVADVELINIEGNPLILREAILAFDTKLLNLSLSLT